MCPTGGVRREEHADSGVLHLLGSSKEYTHEDRRLPRVRVRSSDTAIASHGLLGDGACVDLQHVFLALILLSQLELFDVYGHLQPLRNLNLPNAVQSRRRISMSLQGLSCVKSIALSYIIKALSH